MKEIIPTTRADIARMIEPGGLVIELGVAAGEFAAALLTANPMIEYIGIDRWGDHHDAAEMARAAATLSPWGDKARLIRREFTAARIDFPEACADLVYVDGYAHTGQEGGETLRDWWHSVKPGGIFAGHDYDEKHYPQTVAAVDAFVLEHGLPLHIIEETPHPSWWLSKPHH